MSKGSGEKPKEGEDRVLLTFGWIATVCALLCMAAVPLVLLWLSRR